MLLKGTKQNNRRQDVLCLGNRIPAIQYKLDSRVVLVKRVDFWHSNIVGGFETFFFMKLWFKKTQGADTPATENTDVVVAKLPDLPAQTDTVGSGLKNETEPKVSTAKHSVHPSPAPLPAASSQNPRSLFKQLLDGLYDAVMITDVKGHIVNANSRMTEFFGYTPDETWDLSINRVVPGLTDALIAKIRKGLETERFVMIEGRCTRKNQTTFPAEIAISQIDLMNDCNLLFCVRSIERRQVQMQRLQCGKRLLDQIPTAAVACDRSSTIKVANLALAKMLGYDTPEALYEKPFALVWNEVRAPEVIQRVLDGEAVKEPITVVNTRGKQLQLVISLTPDLDAQKKPIGFLASFTSAAVISLSNH